VVFITHDLERRSRCPTAWWCCLRPETASHRDYRIDLERPARRVGNPPDTAFHQTAMRKSGTHERGGAERAMSSNNANGKLRALPIDCAGGVVFPWYALTSPTLLPPKSISRMRIRRHSSRRTAKVLARIWDWFQFGAASTSISGDVARNGTRVCHRPPYWALLIGPVARPESDGLAISIPISRLANSMPRVILAPIFAIWSRLASGPRWRWA